MSAAQIADEDLVPGDLPEGVLLFGRYRVGAKLAEGSVAAVYAAEDRVTEGRVAIKVFDPLHNADPVARARFAREFQVLVSLNHPGVARALRFESGPHFDALVMELVEGEPLRARLDRAPLNWKEATELGARLSLALEACHAVGVVHRDLKPENIVLHPERGPVILDFGVAWFSSALTLTRTGALLGSPRYLAPELFRSPQVDARADLFALGAILYESLAGRPVRTIESMAELAAHDGPDAPPSLARLRSDLPAHAWPLIERCIAYRLEDRFATAAELGQALGRGSAQLGRRLEDNLHCSGCQTPLVIDLPICPGCGAHADWNLQAGAYAVQLLEVRSPEATAAWLRRRYPGQLVNARWLQRRLRDLPQPLMVGVSEASAESLASQARQVGCRVEVLRGRAVLGPALRVPSASPGEIMAASGLHFGVVVLAGAAMSLLGGPQAWLWALPAVVGAAGVGGAVRYSRRALLRLSPSEDQAAMELALGALRARLGGLQTSRARRLAAAAVARATPVLLSDELGLSEDALGDVRAALERALSRVEQVDAYLLQMQQSPRAQLRAQLAAAETQTPGRGAQLEAELTALTEAALAHDLAVRQTLEACHEISSALSTRVLATTRD